VEHFLTWREITGSAKIRRQILAFHETLDVRKELEDETGREYGDVAVGDLVGTDGVHATAQLSKHPAGGAECFGAGGGGDDLDE
jgi:hypothetical protein